MNKTSFPVKVMVNNHHRENMLTHIPAKGGRKLFTLMRASNRRFEGKHRLFPKIRSSYDPRLAQSG